MRIRFKEPYWVKYKWDLDTHHENQYVTKFNKTDVEEIKTLFHQEKFVVTIEARVLDVYSRDSIFALYGKPGKNMGLTYNNESKIMAFEFWTKSNTEEWDDFNFVSFDNVRPEDIKNGVTLSVARNKDSFTLYKNFEPVNKIRFKNNLIDDYKYTGLFLGCGNPGSPVPEHRQHGEYDIHHFSILQNTSDIKYAREIYESKPEVLLKKPFYSDILCLYNFKTINNIGIVFDESKNNNFLERVPNDFVL